jgi:uncharacterized phiE125 gp8 family phage protein
MAAGFGVAKPWRQKVMVNNKQFPAGEAGPEPVTLEQVRQHLRVDEDQETYDYLSQLNRTAREWVENRTWLGLVVQDWNLYAPTFDPQGIELAPSPVTEVLSVQYYDLSGDLQTLPAGDYWLDIVSEPARITPRDTWPETEQGNPAAVRILYRSGLTDTQVPQQLKHAIKILCSHWYEHREEVVVGTIVARVPLAAQSLCDTVALRRFL